MKADPRGHALRFSLWVPIRVSSVFPPWPLLGDFDVFGFLPFGSMYSPIAYLGDSSSGFSVS